MCSVTARGDLLALNDVAKNIGVKRICIVWWGVWCYVMFYRAAVSSCACTTSSVLTTTPNIITELLRDHQQPCTYTYSTSPTLIETATTTRHTTQLSTTHSTTQHSTHTGSTTHNSNDTTLHSDQAPLCALCLSCLCMFLRRCVYVLSSEPASHHSTVTYRLNLMTIHLQ